MGKIKSPCDIIEEEIRKLEELFCSFGCKQCKIGVVYGKKTNLG